MYSTLSRIWEVPREQCKQKLYWTHAIMNTLLEVYYQHIQFCGKTFERTYFIPSLLKTNLNFLWMHNKQDVLVFVNVRMFLPYKLHTSYSQKKTIASTIAE